jgi:hypothetical protein
MPRRAALLAVLLVLVGLLAACGGDGGGEAEPGTEGAAATDDSTPADQSDGDEEATPYEGYVSEVYAGPEHWACRPDVADDVCDGDLTATEVAADGTQTTVPHESATDPAYDCFYVYPTVDHSPEPGNHSFEQANPLEDVAILTQAARFTEQCRLYVPRYRQATIGSYDEVEDGELFEVTAFQTAYADVLDAFQQYMADDNGGRDVVLLGHSQGSHHLTRLVREEIDGNPALQEQMISALLVGPTGQVTVAEGEDVGGTFDEVPLCTEPDQAGCVVAFDSYWEGAPAPELGRDEGEQRACVNPAALLDGAEGPATASGAYTSPIEPDVVSTFELVEDGFTLECVEDAGGQPYLEVGVDPNAPRSDALSAYLAGRPTVQRSLHTSDWAFPMRDLLDLVEQQAAAMAR